MLPVVIIYGDLFQLSVYNDLNISSSVWFTVWSWFQLDNEHQKFH